MINSQETTLSEFQIGVFLNKDPILLCDGAVGSGKSWIAAEKLLAFARKYPGSNCLMTRKTEESMINSTVLFFEMSVVAGASDVTHVPSKRRFELANGSFIYYGGMATAKQREQIRSIGSTGDLDFVWMEEANAFEERDFEELVGRLRGKAAPWTQIILTTNPDSYYHWINQRLIIGGNATRMQSMTEFNKTLPEHYLENISKNISGVMHDRLVKGLWVEASGLVYDTFSYNTHVIDSFVIPPEWRRYRSIDFGYDPSPNVCQWWAVDPKDGAAILYREIYHTRININTFAELINKYSANEKISFTVADWQRAERDVLHRNGISTIKANKDILLGVQMVMRRMRINPETQRPRILFFADALTKSDPRLDKKPKCTIEEIGIYVWDEKSSKELPIGDNNHGQDAKRYFITALDHNHTSAKFGFLDDIMNNESEVDYLVYNKPRFNRTNEWTVL